MSIYANSEKIKVLPISKDRTGTTEAKYYQEIGNSDLIISEDRYNNLSSDEQIKYTEAINPTVTDPLGEYLNGRTLNELNLTTIYNSFTENSIYIIKEEKSAGTRTNVTLVYEGYIIEITDTNLLNNYSDLRISLDMQDLYESDNTTKKNKYLDIFDYDNELHGIKFYTDNTTGAFQIIKDGEIPTSAYQRFTHKSIASINGGTI